MSTRTFAYQIGYPTQTAMFDALTKETQTTVIGQLEKKVIEWLQWDKNENTIAEIQRLHGKQDVEKLMLLLMGRLQFGAAGLRGRMGAGYTQINDLVIIQTTQGVVQYLLECHDAQAARDAGVVVGFDGRHNSKRFAQLTAGIFANKNFRVFLFSDMAPTAFVPFCLTYNNCVAGIMITASHNPKVDNGYKVYWTNGAQIIPAKDKLIQKHILLNLKPWETSWDFSVLETSHLVKDPLLTIKAEYTMKLQERILDKKMNLASPLKIAYTAMHGVGYKFMKIAFRATGFQPFVEVLEQIYPDPDFPTVRFPNPEEGRHALEKAIATGDDCNCSIILANDADADRLAVAEKEDAKTWRIFTGNELGALLGWWSLHCHKTKHPKAKLADSYMLASTVSSKMLKTMAAEEGFNFVETLTGFKWIANKAVQLIAEGKTVLFGFEESIGFMCGTDVLDKDGISAGVHVAEMATYLQTQKSTLAQQLLALSEKYGYHLCNSTYFTCDDPSAMKVLFEKLRNYNGQPGKYIESLKKGKFKVVAVRDLTTGYDSSTPDHKTLLPSSPMSQMITFKFSNGFEATLRTSGTEPKVKFYTELVAGGVDTSLRTLKSIVTEMTKCVVKEMLQPEVHGLIPRTEEK